MNVILNPDRTRKCTISVAYDKWAENNPQADPLNDIFVKNVPPTPDEMALPQLSVDGATWIEADIQSATQRVKEKNRLQLKTDRDNSLKSIVHDFGDGRIVQVRPQDEINFRVSIDRGVTKDWVLADNTVAPLTVAEMQAAYDEGVVQAESIWKTYTDSLKLI